MRTCRVASSIRSRRVRRQRDKFSDMRSPEAYAGFSRAAHFASGAMTHDAKTHYEIPATLATNAWGLGGDWTIEAERAVSESVTIDGRAPSNEHGVDIDAQGNGTVTAQRLYQLIRQSGDIADHTFTIEFLDPGVQVYAFTFG